MSNQTNSTDLILSLTNLRSTIGPSIVFVITGLISIFANIFTIVIIWKTKSLQTKCFFLMALNSLTDLSIGIGYSIIGALRLYRYFSGIGEVMTTWRCCLEVSLINLSQMLSLAMAAVLVIDRLMATFFPYKYKDWSSYRTSLPLVGSVLIYGFAQLSVHFYDSWIRKDILLLTCNIVQTASDDHIWNLTLVQLVTSALVVGLNCLLALGIWRNEKKHRKLLEHHGTIDPKQTMARKKEMKIFKMITILVLLHISTHLSSRIILLITSKYLSNETKNFTNQIGRNAVVCNSSAHFLLLLLMNSQFRTGAKRLFCSNNSKVIMLPPPS